MRIYSIVLLGVALVLPVAVASLPCASNRISASFVSYNVLVPTSQPRKYRSFGLSKQSVDLYGTLSDDEIIAASKFKIVTCNASSCAAKRKKLQLDEYATFSAFWERAENDGLLRTIQIEETSCLGSCQHSPCVAIEHDDYDGTVALDAMNGLEFEERVFHHVIDNSDVDRVWSLVIDSIRVMALEGDEKLEENRNAV